MTFKTHKDLKPGDLLYFKFKGDNAISVYNKEHIDFIIRIEKGVDSTNFFIYSTLSNKYDLISSDIVDCWLNPGPSDYKPAIIIRP